ncbi:MAG TPA: RtcB family protein [Candidatus Nanoarchaeia archaeon]|nr:RtcB family protein [Candidatus Nanoarchaeia archaeon]
MSSEEKVQPVKISECLYEIPKQGKMNVPVRIYASEKLLKKMMEDNCTQQGINVASYLPGIQKYSIMMPDAHQGYGFSIGGVAAMDYETGCISPGGIGFDINCGVRLLASNLTKEEVEPKIKELLDRLFKNVPSGVGSESFLRLTNEELDEVLVKGARWALEKGHGLPEDVELCEEKGCMAGADAHKVSDKAKSRGRKQIGTLGAGNHFLEVQVVDKIYDQTAAERFGIKQEGQITLMIHCGSRGFGHQNCTDYLRKMEDAYPEVIKALPEKDLIYAPISSPLAQDYLKAMVASANYAWCNRHVIASQSRKSLQQVFPDATLNPVYDIAHNIAKVEEHTIDGVKKKVIVHRKGATRAFGPGRNEVPDKYRDLGQPVLLPGSMGTASYVLIGTGTGMDETFGSTAHGAGREMSRTAAIKKWRGENIKKELEERHIYIKAASWKGISEEAPGAYKDVDEVVRVSHEAGIGKLVVRLVPLGVVKG